MDSKKRKGWISESLYNTIRALMPIATVDLLVMHKERLLLMLRNNEPGKDLWFTPGGRIFLREEIDQAVHRVLREETGLTSLKIERKGVMEHIWPNAESITVFYRVDVAEENVVMNDEHRSYRWISELEPELNIYVKEMVKKAGVMDGSKGS